MTQSDEEALRRLRRQLAAIYLIHYEYLPVHVEFTTCAGCNLLHRYPDVEPWPCPTIRAINEATQT